MHITVHLVTSLMLEILNVFVECFCMSYHLRDMIDDGLAVYRRHGVAHNVLATKVAILQFGAEFALFLRSFSSGKFLRV